MPTTTDHSFPNGWYYSAPEGEAVPWAWALISSQIPVRKGTLSEWLQWTEGRIYKQPEDAWRNQQPSDGIVRLPDEVEFEASTAWCCWAHAFMTDLRQALGSRSVPQIYPEPLKTAHNQLQTGFAALLQRFYHDGLFHVAQCCNLAQSVDQLYLILDHDDCDWAKCIASVYQNESQHIRGTWLLLWNTAAEMLEWYVCRAGSTFGNTDPSVAGRSALPRQNSLETSDQWQELDCLNDLISAWMFCSQHSPVKERPKKIQLFEAYVFGDLFEHWQALLQNHSSPLADPPPLGLLLRMPQLDQVPQGWIWRRQVRTRRGKYFGMEDLLFYKSWDDALDNCRRFRSYKEIAAELCRVRG